MVAGTGSMVQGKEVGRRETAVVAAIAETEMGLTAGASERAYTEAAGLGIATCLWRGLLGVGVGIAAHRKTSRGSKGGAHPRTVLPFPPLTHSWTLPWKTH